MLRPPNSAGMLAALASAVRFGRLTPKRTDILDPANHPADELRSGGTGSRLPRRERSGKAMRPMGVVALALAVGVSVLTTPQAASAQLADLTCVGAGSATATPGVLLSPAPQRFTALLKVGNAVSPATPCTSLTGIPYQGATFEVEGSGVLGCLSGSLTGTAKVTWDNGDVSTAAWSLSLPIFLLPIFDFRLTAGPLAGTRIFAVGVPTGFAGNCVLHPLTRLGGAGFGLLLRF